MASFLDFITEILTGEYGLDTVNYGKDLNGDYQPFEVNVEGKQYVIDEQMATKLDTLLNSQVDGNLNVSQVESIAAKKIKEFLNYAGFPLDAYGTRVFGETAGFTTNYLPLNLDSSKQKMIYIKNGYDVSMTLSLKALLTGDAEPEEIYQFFSGVTVASGATKIINVADYPLIEEPFIYYGLHASGTVGNYGEGLDVIFYGR